MATPRQDIGALSRSMNTSNALRNVGRATSGRGIEGRLSNVMQGRGGGGRATFGPNPPTQRNPSGGLGRGLKRGFGRGGRGGGHRKFGRGVARY